MPFFQQAQNIVLESVSPVPAVSVILLDSVGMIACEIVPAKWDLPAFDYSAMDGYAVRAAECESGRELAVTGRVVAGHHFDQQFPLFSTVKITAGAPVPRGLDAVIPFEGILLDSLERVRVPADSSFFAAGETVMFYLLADAAVL